MKPAAQEDSFCLKTIARVRNDFPTKFGLPRQSGLIDSLQSVIVFEPAYRNADALRGLAGYSHVWLLWGFEGVVRDHWSPMVRPPRLGGNKRMGVFATRSPNRPNPIGLSSVKLLGISQNAQLGATLLVSGADMMDNTPIFDIKPYLPYADSHPEATGGFTDETPFEPLTVVFPPHWLAMIPQALQATLISVLADDPRPAYQDDPARVYGFYYAGFNVRFCVAAGVLTVTEIVSL